MKKLNKKGFTLIELMVVIAILVVLMGLALPNITSSIERSKQKQIDNKRKIIISAGELYFDKHKNLTKTNGVKTGTLVNEGLLKDVEIEGTCPGWDDTECCVYYYNGDYIFNSDGDDCFDNAY